MRPIVLTLPYQGSLVVTMATFDMSCSIPMNMTFADDVFLLDDIGSGRYTLFII